MKILYYVPDLHICNGVASYSMNYFRKIVEIYPDVRIDFLLTHNKETPYYDEIKNAGGNIYFLPKTLNIFKIKKFLNELFKLENYDIVHSHVINRGSIVLSCAKKNNIKVRIIHSHTTSNGDTLIKRIIRYPFKKNVLKLANKYFACSELAGNYLFGKKDFFIINNAVNLDRFDLPELEKQKIRQFYNNNLTFGTVGRFTLQKNPNFILEIIREMANRIQDFKFIWVGSGELFDEIKVTAEEYKISRFIEFIGNTDNVVKYYFSMDVFILPSIYEGLPVVGIEAQCCQIPSIFSTEITKEIKLNDNAYFCDIKSPKQWVDKILEIKGERTGIEKLKEKYEIETNSRYLADLYFSFLKG